MFKVILTYILSLRPAWATARKENNPEKLLVMTEFIEVMNLDYELLCRKIVP